MLADREDAPHLNPSRTQVAGYIEELVTELADLASKHGHTALAASLCIVAIQAAGERRGRGGGR